SDYQQNTAKKTLCFGFSICGENGTLFALPLSKPMKPSWFYQLPSLILLVFPSHAHAPAGSPKPAGALLLTHVSKWENPANRPVFIGCFGSPAFKLFPRTFPVLAPFGP